MNVKISPLAPKIFAELGEIKHVKLQAIEANIKYKNKKDLAIFIFEKPFFAAGVFTKSRCPSAAVDWCKNILKNNATEIKSIVVNSGNANAFTGKQGILAVQQTAKKMAECLQCHEHEILLASTGVIGEPLEATKFIDKFPQMIKTANEKNWHNVAKAITTTDTYPKLATKKIKIDNSFYTINGIAKGSGMIAPDMATMLAFIVTDCPIAPTLLQKTLSELTKTTFNAISVDSDISTSDSVILCSPKSEESIMKESDSRYIIFYKALGELMLDLAKQIVCDGEGAKKLIQIEIEGATSEKMARKVAFSIANSPLVKTAIGGEDANWGRIVMAIGKSGEAIERDKLQIYFGNERVAVAGGRDENYNEEKLTKIMQQTKIIIRVNLGLGEKNCIVWSCDLTKEYVAINGDYRS